MTYEEAWKDQKRFIKGMINQLKRAPKEDMEAQGKLQAMQVLLMRMEDEEELIEE